MIEQSQCQAFFQQNFLQLTNKNKFCDAYWKAMQKCQTLQQAIEKFGVSKVAFRCAIVVRREKKQRWADVEGIIGRSRYASGLYWEYMQRLHERGVLDCEELEAIRGNMRLDH